MGQIEAIKLVPEKKVSIETHLGTFLTFDSLLTWVKLKLLYEEIFIEPVAR